MHHQGLALVPGAAASDDLEVVQLLLFSKSFDGATTPTGTPKLTFAITNPDPDTATGITFSDNVDDVITNLIETNLPLFDICGLGSSLTSTSSSLLALLVPGQSLTYTVTVSNAGPSDAQNLVSADTLPAGLTFVSSASSCTEAGGTVTCPFGVLPVGNSVAGGPGGSRAAG